MVLSTPFEKLPTELVTIVLRNLESPDDIGSVIQADSHILHIYSQNQPYILRPLRQALHHQFPGQNLTQAAVACRLRKMESDFSCLTRAQVKEKVNQVLLRPPEPVARLNLRAMSTLYCLLEESRVLTADYSREAWNLAQYLAAEETGNCGPMIPLSSPLSETEIEQMQKAYLLFDTYRHTLRYSTFLLQDYCTLGEQHMASFYIPYEFAYQDKLVCVRTFQAVFRFVFRKYQHILNRDSWWMTVPTQPEINGTAWRVAKKHFFKNPPQDDLQFSAFLSSQNYQTLIDLQAMGEIQLVKRIASLYRRYSRLKGNPLNSPLVMFADLKPWKEIGCAPDDMCCELWISGAFMLDKERLLQLGEGWIDYAWELKEYFGLDNQSDDESDDEFGV
ncbi:hypothetical protein FHETE_7156 [Fusarium heterosporum]|uniref:Uncharacterized protein n=1 Tax=Fusarium heterosporum TaxID=42747 RepID=A0A8H5T835_FUSHE|nr:hypothetical protein FHETE_7156 [Fusarium heterosporum]